MHSEAYNFVKERLAGTITKGALVLEIGSYNVNGSVRDLFAGCTEYVGVDRCAGPGVDVVCDMHEYMPGRLFDIVVCCEVLEHDPRPKDAFHRMMDWLKPGGILIMTCACRLRWAHTCMGAQGRRDGEHYANVEPGMLELPEGCVVEDSGYDLRVAWTRPLETNIKEGI